MPVITGFKANQDGTRRIVCLDDGREVSVRERVFEALGFKKGMPATPEEIIRKDKFVWKHIYDSKEKRDQENLRVERAIDGLMYCDPRFVITKTGFGADSDAFIAHHPEVAGSPDLSVCDADGNLILCLEVTGTKRMRGNDFWVRPDKIDWARKNPEIETWVALHYSEPREKMLFFKPDPDRRYDAEERTIGQARERFVILTREEVLGPTAFISEVRTLSAAHFRRLETDNLTM